jgi:tripartite-type tricarboxylate transporter receptor subunit TctC
MNRNLLCLLNFVASGAVCAQGVAGDAYPNKPIRFVVPFAAGGPNDIQARMLGEKLAQRVGQQVVIDNRGGAGGNIGMEITAKAPPDGYTIVIATVGTWAVNPHLYKNMPFDVLKDFAPLLQVSTSPGVLIVHPSVKATSIKEFIALAREQPGKFNYGSSGVGGFGHICGELFALMTKTRMTHVPYKSSAPALTDIVGGQIQVLFNNMISTVAQVKGGRVRALGVTGATRSPALPELPTIAEAGVPGYENSSWSAIGAPAKTPVATVSRLHKEFSDILKLPDITAKHIEVGAQLVGGTPEQFRAYLGTELVKFGKLVKAAGIPAASGG